GSTWRDVKARLHQALTVHVGDPDRERVSERLAAGDCEEVERLSWSSHEAARTQVFERRDTVTVVADLQVHEIGIAATLHVKGLVPGHRARNRPPRYGCNAESRVLDTFESGLVEIEVPLAALGALVDDRDVHAPPRAIDTHTASADGRSLVPLGVDRRHERA